MIIYPRPTRSAHLSPTRFKRTPETYAIISRKLRSICQSDAERSQVMRTMRGRRRRRESRNFRDTSNIWMYNRLDDAREWVRCPVLLRHKTMMSWVGKSGKRKNGKKRARETYPNGDRHGRSAPYQIVRYAPRRHPTSNNKDMLHPPHQSSLTQAKVSTMNKRQLTFPAYSPGRLYSLE